MSIRAFGRADTFRRAWPAFTDVFLFAALLSIFYGIVEIGRRWLGAAIPAAQISLSPSALPAYVGYSLLRVAVAYVVSLIFAVAYGYIAAHNRRAEQILIPLLDILQSIPVLSFLPGVMLAMIALFPQRELGLEAGSILLIFTGQVWNIAFSFYSSIKSIPAELYEAARIYRYGWWQQLVQLELPYGAIGLIWNSMMSVAGAWFFLMACEMFVVGKENYRLVGLGSFLQVAAGAGDTPAILWGIGAMIAVVVLVDQLVWRPAIVWADKFKFEQVEGANAPSSAVYDFFRSSGTLKAAGSRFISPAMERLLLFLASRGSGQKSETPAPESKRLLGTLLLAVAAALTAYATSRAVILLFHLNGADLDQLFTGVAATLGRVALALAIGALWTIPAGVAIGFNPRLARVAQPLVQIAASVPATALFPLLVLLLVRVGGGMNTAAILLMLLGTQWYILFNVIAGAIAIPSDLKEAARVFGFTAMERWRIVILPSIFPFLVTGMVTAAGGAWNASIVAEYYNLGGKVLTTTGIGSTISLASDAGNFKLLLAATIVLSATVVAINRLLWRRLYRLAETRYKLET